MRPVGLPWVGSKKSTQKQIADYLELYLPPGGTVRDIFGGGGAISLECYRRGIPVIYNDIQKWLPECLYALLTEDIENSPLFPGGYAGILLSKEDFHKLLCIKSRTWHQQLQLLINSFGNQIGDPNYTADAPIGRGGRPTYLYSQKYSEMKHSLALEILKNEGPPRAWVRGYKQTETYLKAVQQLQQLQRLEQLEQLERLQQLHQLQRLEQLERHPKIQFTSEDYRKANLKDSDLIYLDPPYMNSIGYLTNFNHIELYEWVEEIARNHTVIISEKKGALPYKELPLKGRKHKIGPVRKTEDTLYVID